MPMPGSPPMRSAEPGTMPPPVTRSSSASPVGMRAIRSVLLVSVSSATARPFEARARPEPGAAATSASSISVFHSPQATHLPGPARGHGAAALADELALGGFDHAA